MPFGDWTYQCAVLSVPLDRTGRQPGTLTLEVARESEEVTDAPTPLLVLMGGPGEAGLTYASLPGYAYRGGSFGSDCPAPRAGGRRARRSSRIASTRSTCAARALARSPARACRTCA